jgi:hypothetical protein
LASGQQIPGGNDRKKSKGKGNGKGNGKGKGKGKSKEQPQPPMRGSFASLRMTAKNWQHPRQQLLRQQLHRVQRR